MAAESRPLRLACLLVLCACLWAGGAQAAVLRAVHGRVVVQRQDQAMNAAVGQRLREGDELISEDNAEAVVRFDDGARLALRPGSRLVLRELKQVGEAAQRRKTVKLVQGGLRYISGKSKTRQRVTFETNTSTIGIRGTDIEIVFIDQPQNAEQAGTYLKVNTGLATMQASDGTQVDVERGQLGFSGEPELTPRGLGMTRRPAARPADALAAALFRAGRLDGLMK